MVRAGARRAVATTAVLSLALGGLTACGGDALAPQPVNLPCPVSAGGPVTLVVGARANSPAPRLPEEVQGLVREAAKQSQRIAVVRVDGAPNVALAATFHTNGQNDEIRGRDLVAFLQQVSSAIEGLRPKTPEADVLAALTEAAHITPEGGTVVLLDSGVTTAGQLSFRDGNMFNVDPAEAAAYLQAEQLLPDLSGRAVVLVGLGRTAEPQPALNERLGNRVGELWQTIAEMAGASCVFDLPTASRRTAVGTEVPVTVVALPADPVFSPCGETILADSDTVGFLPDQAVFRDPAAAEQTLRQLADQVRLGRQMIKLTGTTSSAGTSEQGRIALSRQRAEAVKAVLVRLGVAAERVETVGAGSHGPHQVNDRAPNGSLIPAAAAQNRSVVVQLICTAG